MSLGVGLEEGVGRGGLTYIKIGKRVGRPEIKGEKGYGTVAHSIVVAVVTGKSKFLRWHQQ